MSMSPDPMAHTFRSDAAHKLGRRVTLLVNSLAGSRWPGGKLGNYGYSYHFVLEAMRPLLARWAEVVPVAHPESQIEYLARQAVQRGRAPLALGFRPLENLYLSRQARNIVFPFWEFPDIPDRDYDGNPRRNWARIANCADLILTASHFTAAALARAGVRRPIRVVPVPVHADYFEIPAWTPGQSVVLNCDAYVFSRPESPTIDVCDPEARPGPDNRIFRLKSRAVGALRWLWLKGIKPRLPLRLSKSLVAAKEAGRLAWREGEIELPEPSRQLELSGVVYTSIFNPDDRRKNWQDMLTAFLAALGDRDDALLVVKLVTSGPAAVRDVLRFYQRIGTPHRCRVAFISGYLSDEAMRELARGTTYYLNTSRAEGACLPLQDYLAAGRPAVAPVHTALADYFDAGVGFVVASHSEPCPWPWDESGRLSTSWHRIVWSSLRGRLVESYDTAKQRHTVYRELASQARKRIAEWAGAENVGRLLHEALDEVMCGSLMADRGIAPPPTPSAIRDRQSAID